MANSSESTPRSSQDIRVTVCKTAKDADGYITSVSDVVGFMRSAPKLEAATKTIREVYRKVLTTSGGDANKAKKAVSQLKQALPGVLWSGAFSRRANEALENYSHFICADLDDLGADAIQSLVEKLLADEHVHLAFRSPTDTGIKAVFAVAGDAENHLWNYLAVEKYVKDRYGLEIDKACKDKARLCFLAYAPDAAWKNDAVPLEPLPIPKKVKAETKPRHQPRPAERQGRGDTDDEGVSLELLKELLTFVPADDRQDWLTVLAAVKLYGEQKGQTDAAYQIADEWAQQSSKYDADDQQKTWDSLERGEGENVATIGSVFHLAKKHGWSGHHAPDEDEQLIRKLAEMGRVQYERIKKQYAADLKLTITALDKFVRQERARIAEKRATEEKAASLGFQEPEPWPDPVPAQDLVGSLVTTLERFLVLPRHMSLTAALWIIHTYCYQAFAYSPILSIRSPEKRCGKSRFLEVLNNLVRKPFKADDATGAVMFRAIGTWEPTFLLDEWDSIRDERRENIRNVLNSGFHRLGRVPRCEGDNHEIKLFPTFCPKAVSGIGCLPDTAADRSIELLIHRRLPGEKVERFRNFDGGELRSKIARWVSDSLQALEESQPNLPEWMNDRQQDIWEPLLAIADLCAWGDDARNAGQLLSQHEREESIHVELLRDIQKVFSTLEDDKASTEDLLFHLNKMDERPWPTLCDGKPIHARRLADMLRRFDIAPDSVRIGRRTPKGYTMQQFQDAFARYLPPMGEGLTEGDDEEP